MKLMKIGVNWSAKVDENWWKLMKIKKVVKIGKMEEVEKLSEIAWN